jgi:DinB family protein
MHPRLAELFEYAGAQRRTLLAAVEAVPANQRDRRPAEGVWSVAEVLEHLCRTERGVASLVARRLADACAAGLECEGEVGSVLGALDRYRIPQTGRRVPAPEPVRPTGTWSWSEGVMRLAASREALERAVAPGDGLALDRVVHPHPMLGPLSLYQWILFVGQHEARHAAQVRAWAGAGVAE